MATQFNVYEKNTLGTVGIPEVWDIARIKPNPLNPRGELSKDDPTLQELAASIKQHGLLEPVLVTSSGFLVAGHRRRMACMIAEVNRVRVIVKDYTEAKQLEIMLVENIQRKDLTPLQEAKAYQKLIDGGINQTDVARKLGLNAAVIHARRQILNLEPEVQRLFDSKETPTTVIPILARVKDRDRQLRYGTMIARRSMPVKRLEKLIEASENVTRPAQKTKQRNLPEARTGVARSEAVRLLLAHPKDKQISYGKIFAVLSDTCCACGLTGFSETTEINICSACPLPQLIKAIAEV